MLQVSPQAPFTQVAMPFDDGHGAQELPQLWTLVLSRQSPKQLWKPVLQTIKQLVPLHAAEAFGAVGQGVHEAAQVSGLVFETHWPEQSWKPVLQVVPHTKPSHVALVLGPSGQGVHHAPQVAGLVFDAH